MLDPTQRLKLPTPSNQRLLDVLFVWVHLEGKHGQGGDPHTPEESRNENGLDLPPKLLAIVIDASAYDPEFGLIASIVLGLVETESAPVSLVHRKYDKARPEYCPQPAMKNNASTTSSKRLRYGGSILQRVGDQPLGKEILSPLNLLLELSLQEVKQSVEVFPLQGPRPEGPPFSPEFI